MNILFINTFCVGFMVSEIPRVSVFGYFPLILENLENLENLLYKTYQLLDKLTLYYSIHILYIYIYIYIYILFYWFTLL